MPPYRNKVPPSQLAFPELERRVSFPELRFRVRFPELRLNVPFHPRAMQLK